MKEYDLIKIKIKKNEKVEQKDLEFIDIIDYKFDSDKINENELY